MAAIHTNQVGPRQPLEIPTNQHETGKEEGTRDDCSYFQQTALFACQDLFLVLREKRFCSSAGSQHGWVGGSLDPSGLIALDAEEG